ncbi:MAG: serine/threonine protein kinase [Planctomycetes bacterium]|jgi:serine/threonine-protein kinase|nr:serine/threonine protein kinase [Planctomycetota bacterium]
MISTTVSQDQPSFLDADRYDAAGAELLTEYETLLRSDTVHWAAEYKKIRILGKGGQGVVYLSERQGTDLFSLPVAVKIFSPESYRDVVSYLADMARIAAISSRVALIQHDNLLDLHNFIEHGGVRIMIMEWIDGYDLRELTSEHVYDKSRARLSPERWAHVSQVILGAGPAQSRFKPGIAIQILRECLAGLAALHREGIVHGDLKPANIMVKRTGNAKIIDIGSAMDLDQASARRMWSPAYAAPEILRGGKYTPQSDLASLGYVLIEMLAGQSPFEGLNDLPKLLAAKLNLDKRLKDLLPADVSCNEMLLHLCQKLIAPDPARRFQNAQSADLDRRGAAHFHRQLVKGDLASEYEHDLRLWLEELD